MDLKDEEDEAESKPMFIPITQSYGTVPRKNLMMYFCEVPPAPAGLQEASEIREQIKELERRLESLGG